MRGTWQVVGRVTALIAGLAAVMVGLGLLITKVLQHDFPFAQEDGIDRTFAAHRDPTGNAVSGFFSFVGSTTTIIGVMLIVAVIFRLVFKRWRESAFLILAVSAQAFVFLLTTLVISRARPGVPKLDSSPPTSSFPSGHTGASTALYVGIAVVLAWHFRRSWARGPVVTVLLLVPISVAVGRLYRGMHHPSDVIAALLNGSLCVLIAARNVLFGLLPDGLAKRLDGGRTTTRSAVSV